MIFKKAFKSECVASYFTVQESQINFKDFLQGKKKPHLKLCIAVSSPSLLFSGEQRALCMDTDCNRNCPGVESQAADFWTDQNSCKERN